MKATSWGFKSPPSHHQAEPGRNLRPEPGLFFCLPLAAGAVSILSPFTRLSLGLRCRSGCRVPVAHNKAPTEAGAETGANTLPAGEPHCNSRPEPGLFFCPPLAAGAVSILSPFKISDCFCSRDFCNIPSLFTFLWDLGKVNQDKRNHSSVIKHKTGPGIPLRESRTCFYKERVLQPGKGSPAGEKITCRRFPPRSAKLRLLCGEDPLPARSQRRAESHKRGPDRG